MVFSYESEIVGDIIKIFSAAVIAQDLLIKPKVRSLLFEKYSSFKTNDDDEEYSVL